MDCQSGISNKSEKGMKIMKKTLCTLLAALALTLCINGISFGQETTGSLTGTVKDANGAPVAGATVTVTDPSKDNAVVRTVTTTDDGVYSVPDIKAGPYTVSAEAPNFKKSVTTGVTVNVGKRREQAIVLEAGRIDEAVTVTAEAIGVELNAPTASTTINGDQVRELSLNNRNWVQLITLSPGVSPNIQDQIYVGTTNPNGVSNALQIAVNGVRPSSNTYTVDGADTTDRGANLTVQTYPSIDAIQEFSILRGLYPAETGRSSGAQVNVITKSGSSKFHGDVYEFFRNDWLNANSFSSNRNHPLGIDENGKAIRAPFRYNDFGGTIGGPLWWPHFGEGGPHWEKNNTFFFFSEEIRRVIVYPSANTTVPNANLRQGVFAQPVCAGPVSDPCSVITSSIPQASWSPLARAYVQDIYSKLPLPDANGNLFFPTRGVFNFRQELIRIDHKFSNKFSAYYRFENDTIPTIEPFGIFSGGSGLPGVSTTKTNSPGRSHVGRATWTPSANDIFEFGASYSFGDVPSIVTGLLANENSPNIAAHVPTLPFTPTRGRVPTIGGNGFSGLSTFGPYSDFSYNKSFFGTFTKIWHSHTMKFGGNFAWIRKHENSLPGDTNEGSYGAVSATPTACTANPPTGPCQRPLGTSTTNQLWANFLLGNFQTFNQSQFDLVADLKSSSIEAYAQDEWRFKSNLTFYYGMRFSRYASPWDVNGRLTSFDPLTFNPSQAFQVAGNGNRIAGSAASPFTGLIVNSQNPVAGMTVSPYGKAVTRTPNNFAPRVGIAWDPFKKGTTSVRAGYGIYFDQVSFNPWETIISTNPPFQQKITLTQTTLDNPVGGSQVISSAVQDVYGIDPNFKTPYVQHWSLDVQHQFGSKTLVTAGYYGSKGVHLTGLVDLNLLPPQYAINLGATGCAPLTSATTTKTVPCQTSGQIFTTAGQEAILNQIRPFRGYGAVRYLQTAFDSNYHSLQITAQHRFTRSSQINLAYTWAKNMTNSQNEFGTAPQNTYDLKAEYARANLDRRHVLSLNYIYELPYYSKQEGFKGKLLGGWQLSGIFYYYTGLAFSPATSSNDPAGLGLLGNSPSGARPDLTCDPNSTAPQQLPPAVWFNTTCFVNPTTNRVGNAGRNTINGPSTTRLDSTLSKNFRFTETMNLQLRWEVYNVFNHTNLTTFSSLNNTSSVFGQANIAVTRDPRTMQLGIKFIF
jgi:hypothetical protein